MSAKSSKFAVKSELPKFMKKPPARRARPYKKINLMNDFRTVLPVPPAALSVPTAQRLFQVAAALYDGISQEEVVKQTQFDPWFVQQMAEIMAVPEPTVK